MRSNLTTQERFATVEAASVPRSTFDRSFGHKTTMDAGILYPLYWDLALPGDTFKVKATIFGRLATPLKPIMDNMYVDVHFFSVPYRLVYNNFKKLMGEQENPGDSTNYTIPMMTPPSGGYAEASIYDYFGLPTKVDNYEHSSLPLRAYGLIWDEWYRDQDLQQSKTINKGDEIDLYTDHVLLPRNKRKDYFTSARPWAQKAQPVSIPLNGNAPISSDPLYVQLDPATIAPEILVDPTNKKLPTYPVGYNSSSVRRGFHTNPITAANLALINSTPASGMSAFNATNGTLGSGTNYPHLFDPNGTLIVDPTGLTADLSEVSLITINQFREAVALQQFYEIDARSGTRYTETIKAHFNVTSPDARLQRPEYLGGGSSPLTINPIAQQSASTSGQTPQGNLAAIGTINVNTNGFVKTFTEHEIIIGLVSIRADLNYQQGLNRLWSHKTRYDFFWPSFANLGEQTILNKELVTTGDEEHDEGVFGYQERYSEYRFRPSQITGLFRSNADQSLDMWHLAQEFDNDPEEAPALNDMFIRELPPVDRCIAVPSEPQFIIDAFFDNVAARPMPVRSTPGLTRL